MMERRAKAGFVSGFGAFQQLHQDPQLSRRLPRRHAIAHLVVEREHADRVVLKRHQIRETGRQE